jgi:hypothetical protein
MLVVRMPIRAAERRRKPTAVLLYFLPTRPRPSQQGVVRRQIDAGLLSVADLQSGLPAACALPQEANEHTDVIG